MAWGGYSNGQIPLSALTPLGGGQYAHPAAATAWARMVAACLKATGVRLGVTEGYRPLGVPADRNVTVESKTSTGGSNQWYQKGREDRGLTPSAAIPGTSVHGWGLAIDISNYNPVWSWLKANARTYGFAVDVIADERWHIEFVGSLTIPASTILTNLRGELMKNPYLYIYTPAVGAAKGRPAKPVTYALINVETLPDGAITTESEKRAKGWNRLTQMKGIRYDRATFEATVEAAADLAKVLVNNVA